jgi:hypothetical protein
VATAKDYAKEVNRVGRMEVRIKSLDEAQETLSELRDRQKRLRLIKRYVNAAMKAIRADYRQKTSGAVSVSGAFARGLGKKGAARRMQANKKRRLTQERDRALQPYDRVKLTIDDLLAQMDSTKLKVQAYIEREKARAR